MLVNEVNSGVAKNYPASDNDRLCLLCYVLLLLLTSKPVEDTAGSAVQGMGRLSTSRTRLKYSIL